MAWPETCDELVEQVKARGPKALAGKKWLDQIVDIDGAADFTGLSIAVVRAYHARASRYRAHEGRCLRCHQALAKCSCDAGPLLRSQSGNPSKRPVWIWPEPDMVLARHPGWKLRTLVLSRAEMPGRGTGGGRPWPKRARAS